MKSRQKISLLVVFLVMFGVIAYASEDAWQRFNSSNHFSVTYPSTWFRIGASTDRLQLLSSKTGAEGTVIERGQAEIIVMEAEGSSAKTLDQIVDYYTQGSSLLSRKVVATKPVNMKCKDLVEITSKEQAVPPTDSPISVPFVINTDFFCTVDDLKIVTLVRNWEGDDRQKDYEQIALRMTTSIRVTPHHESR